MQPGQHECRYHAPRVTLSAAQAPKQPMANGVRLWESQQASGCQFSCKNGLPVMVLIPKAERTAQAGCSQALDRASPCILLCFAFGVGDDGLGVSSVVGHNGAEGSALPTAWLTGKVVVDEVLILSEHRHKALPNAHCDTSKMIRNSRGLVCQE